MTKFALCLVLLGACGDDDSGTTRTPELLTETAGLIESVAVGDAVYLATLDKTIWTAPKEPGSATTLVADQPAAELSIAGGYLYWGSVLASVSGDRFELGRVALAGGAAQVLVDDAAPRSFVVAGDTVYWTTINDATADARVTIYSVPAAGGTPAVVTTGGLIESAGALAIDDERIYVSTNKTLNSRLLSFARDGSDGVALTGDVAGTGGIGYIAARGDTLYFLASTGGGSYSTMLKAVPKTGGEPVTYSQGSSLDDTYCTSMQGIALDDDFIYVACRAHTVSLIRRVAIGGGAFSTLAVFPDAANPGAESYTPAIAVLDESYIYVGLGPRLYRVEK